MSPPIVQAFGPLHLEFDGRRLGPTDLGGRKPKVLLEILLLADGHPIPRERLAELLWDRDPPRNVPGTLDTYASVLRRTLAGHRHLLVTEPEAYRLVRSELLVDLDRFDALVARSAQLERGAAQRELLEDALHLVGGEVLADEPYAPWLLETREHYQRRVLDVAVAAGTAALLDHDHAAALRHAERVLHTDPLDERAHRLAMVGHHLAGVGAAALRAYERCREALAEQLGTDPSRATEQLHLDVLRGRPAAELVAGFSGGPQPAPSTPKVAARRGRAMHVLLVEDTPSEARLIRGALQAGAVPIRVEHVADGETALELLQTGASTPDLVLLDLGLPGLDGHEVLAELKQAPQLRRIPVIMLTSSAAQTDVTRSYDLHANSYLTKPTSAEDLTEVVRAIELFWPLTASGADPAP